MADYFQYGVGEITVFWACGLVEFKSDQNMGDEKQLGQYHIDRKPISFNFRFLKNKIKLYDTAKTLSCTS